MARCWISINGKSQGSESEFKFQGLGSRCGLQGLRFAAGVLGRFVAHKGPLQT